MNNWKELAATSHYQTAVAIGGELASGHVQEAATGIEELIEAVARSERRAMRSQLIRLMFHIFKWQNQPDKRSPSWAVTILQAREEIAATQEEVPSLARGVIEEMWDYSTRAALRQTEAETGQRVVVRELDWSEVFEADYKTAQENGTAPSE